jgi:hypothetical protein
MRGLFLEYFNRYVAKIFFKGTPKLLQKKAAE